MKKLKTNKLCISTLQI